MIKMIRIHVSIQELPPGHSQDADSMHFNIQVPFCMAHGDLAPLGDRDTPILLTGLLVVMGLLLVIPPVEFIDFLFTEGTLLRVEGLETPRFSSLPFVFPLVGRVDDPDKVLEEAVLDLFAGVDFGSFFFLVGVTAEDNPKSVYFELQIKICKWFTCTCTGK